MTTNDISGRNASIEELEARIRTTQESLSSKLTILAEELRVSGRESITRVADRVEQGVDRVTERLEHGVGLVSEKVGRGVEQAAGTVKQVGAKVEHMVDNMKDAVDLREQVRKKPLTAVAIATVAGILLTRTSAGRRRLSAEVAQAPQLRPTATAAVFAVLGAWLRPVLETVAMTIVNNGIESFLANRNAQGSRDGGFGQTVDATGTGLPH